MKRTILTVALATLVVASMGVAPVVADHTAAPTDDPDINYGADAAPDVRPHADAVTISEHDRSQMSSPLEYYDDNGEVQSLAADGAEMNDSLDAPVGVNLSKIKDIRYRTFPRLSSESGNGASWTNAANWTTSSSTNVTASATATKADGANVSTVTFDFSDSEATYSDNGKATYSRVDITSDATKRVPQVGANVNFKSTDALVEIRFIDGDGDYVVIEANQSGDASTDESVLTSTSATAVVAQQKVNDLTVEGTGDGTFDGIQSVAVAASGTDASATVEVFWLDAAKKSTEDIAEIMRDTDGDGTKETTYVEDVYTDGPIYTTSLSTLPDWSNDATVFDLEVKDVSFPSSNVEDSHDEINLSSHPTYDGGEMDYQVRHTPPAQIDLSYTNLTLLADQTVPSDRYEMVEYATAVGSTNFSNVSYTAATSSFDKEGKTIILVTNLNAGEEWAVHYDQALTTGERDALESTAAAGGPVDSSSSGGFFSTVFGKIVGALVAVGGILFGKRSLMGGS